MSGRILIDRPGSYVRQKHDHIVFHLKSSKATKKDIRLIFNDPRRFGFLNVYKNNSLDFKNIFKELGPEPLTANFNTKALQNILFKRVTSIKSVLLNQKLIAGLGNIYVYASVYWLIVLSLALVAPWQHVWTYVGPQLRSTPSLGADDRHRPGGGTSPLTSRKRLAPRWRSADLVVRRQPSCTGSAVWRRWRPMALWNYRLAGPWPTPLKQQARLCLSAAAGLLREHYTDCGMLDRWTQSESLAGWIRLGLDRWRHREYLSRRRAARTAEQIRPVAGWLYSSRHVAPCRARRECRLQCVHSQTPEHGPHTRKKTTTRWSFETLVTQLRERWSMRQVQISRRR